MKNDEHLTLRWAQSVREAERDAWNRLALPLDTPFLEHEWLSLLESSGSITPRTGWEPRFLLAFRGENLAAACPLYRKNSSEGEFVYDYFWAEAAEALGMRYFPKLVGMSPVTPVGAYQFLLSPEEEPKEIVPRLCSAILDYCADTGMAGVHFQYTHPDWVEPFREAGFMLWEHPCYIWENRGYAVFDDFLRIFNKNGRRNIRREEESLARQGFRLQVMQGDEIDPAWHKIMYRYYLATNAKFGYWACLYLTEDFFRGLFHDFRKRLVLAAAFAAGEGEPAGLALFLRKGDRLWGRYWGSREFVPHLHFNACYYAPLRWSIEEGIRFFDPGIGSEHKSRRGFTARAGSSLHAFVDPRFNLLFRDNIPKLNALNRRSILSLNSGKKNILNF